MWAAGRMKRAGILPVLTGPDSPEVAQCPACGGEVLGPWRNG